MPLASCEALHVSSTFCICSFFAFPGDLLPLPLSWSSRPAPRLRSAWALARLCHGCALPTQWQRLFLCCALALPVPWLCFCHGCACSPHHHCSGGPSLPALCLASMPAVSRRLLCRSADVLAAPPPELCGPCWPCLACALWGLHACAVSLIALVLCWCPGCSPPGLCGSWQLHCALLLLCLSPALPVPWRCFLPILCLWLVFA